MTPRIAIIGGGSAHWTPRLLVDFVNTAPLAESEVVLMDTAPESLPAVQAVADHVVSLASRGTGAGAGLDVTTTTDLNAALAGAQFVITAYSVGGFGAMVHDLTIPEAHGLPQPVVFGLAAVALSRAYKVAAAPEILRPVAVVPPLRMVSMYPAMLVLEEYCPIFI